MLKKHRISAYIFFGSALLLGIAGSLHAEVSPELIAKTDASIDTLRKRSCSVTFTYNGQPLGDQRVQIIQLHNDFGFGGTFHTVGLNMEDSAMYIDLFPRLFDWAVPENEMKWPTTDKSPDTIDYSLADRLVDWCIAHDIKVRGHNLFWNEDLRWLPEWTLGMNPTEFRAAMERRIDSAVTHFKGRVAHWDIVNELIHYPQATHGTPEVTLFDSATADPGIFNWILKRAREIDPVAKFTINEYAILEALDATPETFGIFVDKMNRLLTDTSSFDIVGLEGHFGPSIEQPRYAANLDSVTKAIPRPIWLTEVDWTVFEDVPDRMEEIMRTAFAHPNVGGLMLWSWWEARPWRSDITSMLADAICFTTEAGDRWLELRDKWKTKMDTMTDAAGQVAFRGFQGEYVGVYRVGDKTYSSRFYLEPGTGAKTVTLAVKDSLVTDTVGIRNTHASMPSTTWMHINGRGVRLNGLVMPDEPLFVYTYTVSGRQLSKMPVTDLRRISVAPAVASGCRVVRVGTESKTLFSGSLMDLK